VLEPVLILNLDSEKLQPRYACEVIHRQCNQAAHTKADEQSNQGDLRKVVPDHGIKKTNAFNESDGLAFDLKQPGNLFPY
jgi:hypothetical protein